MIIGKLSARREVEEPDVCATEEVRRTVTLHDGQELDDDLGGRADHDLALAGLLGVVDGVERIVEDGSLDHFEGLAMEILKRRVAAVGGICVQSLGQPSGASTLSAKSALRCAMQDAECDRKGSSARPRQGDGVRLQSD